MMAKSFVVVDRSRTCGTHLRDSVIKSGDVAHVFSKFEPALEMIERKQIDAVLVEFDTDKETTTFCAAAQALGIPVVFLSTPVHPFDGRDYGFVASFPDLPNRPSLPVQYVHH
jgi:DNA-binding response OmpR family regulator